MGEKYCKVNYVVKSTMLLLSVMFLCFFFVCVCIFVLQIVSPQNTQTNKKQAKTTKLENYKTAIKIQKIQKMEKGMVWSLIFFSA